MEDSQISLFDQAITDADDRAQYKEVRQQMINALKTDLMGPQEPEEILDENPMFAYLVGMLYPQSATAVEGVDVGEQEVEADIAYEDGEDYTAGEEDDNEPISATRFKQQSSIGISFYLANTVETINLALTWGDYIKSTDKKTNKEGKEVSVAIYKRLPMQSTVVVNFSEFDRFKEYALEEDSNVKVHVARIGLKGGYSLVTAYVINKRPTAENSVESIMFQVELSAYAPDNANVFLAEHICRKVLAEDEFYFEQRPILGRGRGCAATWKKPVDGASNRISSDFIRANETDSLNKDGGVTAILRYTLRLLTTQQRDRITKMVVAAEMIRRKEYPKFGQAPISIGFWVGGQVTPNTFGELVENAENHDEVRRKKNMLFKQLLTCPFCGKPLTEDEFYIDPDTKSASIYCADRNCIFFKYKQNAFPIPVYLVDEEIYAKCPTIILSTVDKFARLPWDPNTNALFGRVDRLCSRDGYVAIGQEHKRHNKTSRHPRSTITPVKPFAPPELIIQDELHLITGPLGTIYGAYETIIEDLCTYWDGDVLIKPKYVVSTATIKNASEQTKCLGA